MARIFDVVEYPSEMMDEIVHRFPEAGVADLRIGSQVIVRESQRAGFFPRWESAGCIWTRPAYHHHRQHPGADRFHRQGFQRPHAVHRGSLFRFDAGIRRPQMGNPAADHRPQPGHGPGRGASAGLWLLQLPDPRSAAVCDPDRRRAGYLPDVRYRKPPAHHAALQAAGSAG